MLMKSFANVLPSRKKSWWNRLRTIFLEGAKSKKLFMKKQKTAKKNLSEVRFKK